MQVALLGNPFAVEQHLQGGTQGGEAKTLVFHFDDDRVVVGISNVGQVIQTAVRDRAGCSASSQPCFSPSSFRLGCWPLPLPFSLPTVALPSLETRQQIPTQPATGPLNFSPATKLSDPAFLPPGARILSAVRRTRRLIR